MYNIEGPGVLGSLNLGSASNVVYDNVTRTYVRPDGSPTPFNSILTSMWYCIITMTTVGYGDATPVTVVGQITAMLLMLFSLIVLALPITIIGANFDEEYRVMRLDAMHARRQAMKDTQQAEKVANQLLGKVGKEAQFGNAVHKVQLLIRDAHMRLSQDVDLLMNKQENELRETIKSSLYSCYTRTTSLSRRRRRRRRRRSWRRPRRRTSRSPRPATSRPRQAAPPGGDP